MNLSLHLLIIPGGLVGGGMTNLYYCDRLVPGPPRMYLLLRYDARGESFSADVMHC